MFVCENDRCCRQVETRQPINYIISERRQKTYEVPVKRGRKVIGSEIIEGWEIVTELKVCPKCYQVLTGKTPKMQMKPKLQPKQPVKFDTRRPTRKKPWQNSNDRKGSTHSKRRLS